MRSMLAVGVVAFSMCTLAGAAVSAAVSAPSLAGCAASWNHTGPGSQRATVTAGHSLKAFILAGSTTCTIQFTLGGIREAVAEGLWKNGRVASWLPLRVITVSPTLVEQSNASVKGATLKYPI